MGLTVASWRRPGGCRPTCGAGRLWTALCKTLVRVVSPSVVCQWAHARGGVAAGSLATAPQRQAATDSAPPIYVLFAEGAWRADAHRFCGDDSFYVCMRGWKRVVGEAIRSLVVCPLLPLARVGVPAIGRPSGGVDCDTQALQRKRNAYIGGGMRGGGLWWPFSPPWNHRPRGSRGVGR